MPFVKLGGEQVYPFQRDEIAQHFGARVFESYGSTEMGPIAHECPAGSRHIMADHVYLEIFNGDEPAQPGEFGDLVLTSLFNRAMPLVRCRIGDRGQLSPESLLLWTAASVCYPSSLGVQPTCLSQQTASWSTVRRSGAACSCFFRRHRRAPWAGCCFNRRVNRTGM